MRASLLVLLLALSACSGETPEADRSVRDASAKDASGEAEVGFGDEIRGRVLAAEANPDDEFEIGVTDEVMFFRLTEATRAEARKEMDEGTSDGGLGDAIKDAVGGVVNKALATTVQVPLEQVEDVRYERGRLFVETADDGPQFSVGDEGRDEASSSTRTLRSA